MFVSMKLCENSILDYISEDGQMKIRIKGKEYDKRHEMAGALKMGLASFMYQIYRECDRCGVGRREVTQEIVQRVADCLAEKRLKEDI